MGKGDKRTRRGKLFNRSYGKSRLQGTASAKRSAAKGKKKATK